MLIKFPYPFGLFAGYAPKLLKASEAVVAPVPPWSTDTGTPILNFKKALPIIKVYKQ